MSTGLFNLKKALQVFGTTPEALRERGIDETSFPPFARSASDNRTLKSWSWHEMPIIGEKTGFLAKPSRPVAVAVFVTKGGVLKSTLTLNLARTAALHGIRTCVVGLDMQGDVTTTLGAETVSEESDSLGEALEKMSSLRGLADVFSGDASLDEVIRPTEIPTLFYLPETPELVALDQSLVNRNRREYWLRDQVVRPLKERFDLVIMDCSPNWNRLITNSLIACDVLVSPLECKINNFRNLKAFRALLAEFKRDMEAGFQQIFVPTRLARGRKLSQEIFEWYRGHLPECTTMAIRESLQGEEAMALRISIPEHQPASETADEMRTLLNEIWQQIRSCHDLAERGSRYTATRTAEISI